MDTTSDSSSISTTRGPWPSDPPTSSTETTELDWTSSTKDRAVQMTTDQSDSNSEKNSENPVLLPPSVRVVMTAKVNITAVDTSRKQTQEKKSPSLDVPQNHPPIMEPAKIIRNRLEKEFIDELWKKKDIPKQLVKTVEEITPEGQDSANEDSLRQLTVSHQSSTTLAAVGETSVSTSERITAGGDYTELDTQGVVLDLRATSETPHSISEDSVDLESSGSQSELPIAEALVHPAPRPTYRPRPLTAPPIPQSSLPTSQSLSQTFSSPFLLSQNPSFSPISLPVTSSPSVIYPQITSTSPSTSVSDSSSSSPLPSTLQSLSSSSITHISPSPTRLISPSLSGSTTLISPSLSGSTIPISPSPTTLISPSPSGLTTLISPSLSGSTTPISPSPTTLISPSLSGSTTPISQSPTTLISPSPSGLTTLISSSPSGSTTFISPSPTTLISPSSTTLISPSPSGSTTPISPSLSASTTHISPSLSDSTTPIPPPSSASTIPIPPPPSASTTPIPPPPKSIIIGIPKEKPPTPFAPTSSSSPAPPSAASPLSTPTSTPLHTTYKTRRTSALPPRPSTEIRSIMSVNVLPESNNNTRLLAPETTSTAGKELFVHARPQVSNQSPVLAIVLPSVFGVLFLSILTLVLFLVYRRHKHARQPEKYKDIEKNVEKSVFVPQAVISDMYSLPADNISVKSLYSKVADCREGIGDSQFDDGTTELLLGDASNIYDQIQHSPPIYQRTILPMRSTSDSGQSTTMVDNDTYEGSEQQVTPRLPRPAPQPPLLVRRPSNRTRIHPDYDPVYVPHSDASAMARRLDRSGYVQTSRMTPGPSRAYEDLPISIEYIHRGIAYPASPAASVYSPIALRPPIAVVQTSPAVEPSEVSLEHQVPVLSDEDMLETDDHNVYLNHVYSCLDLETRQSDDDVTSENTDSEGSESPFEALYHDVNDDIRDEIYEVVDF